MPGGAAWLTDPDLLPCEAPAARCAVELLVEVHQLRRVVLIAHAGCGFYLSRLGLPPERCVSRERADLLHVGHWLRERYPQLNVGAYYAERRGQRVHFERVFGALAAAV